MLWGGVAPAGVNPRSRPVFPLDALGEPVRHFVLVPYLFFTPLRSAMPTPRPDRLARLLTASAFVLLAGCSTSAPFRGLSPATEQAQHLPTTTENETEARLLAAADAWLGTPYRFGGTTRSGVDCSAFVRAVYADAFGLPLSRSTRTQVREGREVERRDLRTGDLVFFRTGPNQRHVGIYLAGGRLLHASSSQNRILVDDFGQGHFQRTYWTARRLLAVAPGLPVLPPAAAEVPPEPAPGLVQAAPPRSGW